MIEYLEDLIEVNPHEALPAEAVESGQFIFRTGDAAVDKVERAIAEGKDVDFIKEFQLPDAQMKAWLDKRKPAAKPDEPIEEPPDVEFSDKYEE